MSRWSDNPFEQFSIWFEEAKKHPLIRLPEAVCLSTLDLNGFPDGRMVLLKHFDEKGFVFYTNLTSVKGQSLQACAKASLTFHWEACKRQVRIQGTTQITSNEEADAYFKTRPRLYQIGAWASQQSAALPNRFTLLRRVAQYTVKFAGKKVPRPPFWTGFRLIPLKMEFWCECPNRLHDRILFQRNTGDDHSWKHKQLYP